MAVIGLHESRPRRSKSNHDSIKVLPRDRMARVSETIALDATIDVLPDVVHEETDEIISDAGSEGYQSEDGHVTLLEYLKSRNSQLDEQVQQLRARQDAYDQQTPFSDLYAQMQKVIKERVKKEVTTELTEYIQSQTQVHVKIEDLQTLLLDWQKDFDRLLQWTNFNVKTLEDLNATRQARKDRPFYRRYNPIGADAAVDALPALLAQLKAAE